MTNTREPQTPRAAAADHPSTDDTAGFAGINTTRSNIKHGNGVVSPFVLGGGFTPSFATAAPTGADVAGFVASGPMANERDQPVDDTVGFGLLNTTRSNIKGAAVLSLDGPLGVFQFMPPVGGAGIAVPAVGSQIAIKENGVR
ncbi:MAG: hypothetical protein AB7R89_21460 [Dehalococcoidia bacterium]